jgi:mono/diheme cytochrome c family protein
MPAFGAKYAVGFGGPPVILNEAQIAAVINYVRTNFGNHYTDPITAAQVGALDRSPH